MNACEAVSAFKAMELPQFQHQIICLPVSDSQQGKYRLQIMQLAADGTTRSYAGWRFQTLRGVRQFLQRHFPELAAADTEPLSWCGVGTAVQPGGTGDRPTAKM